MAEYRTIEAGKYAYLLRFDADPVADIKKIQKVSTVMHDGRVIDTEKLRTNPVLFAREAQSRVP